MKFLLADVPILVAYDLAQRNGHTYKKTDTHRMEIALNCKWNWVDRPMTMT